MGFLRGLAGLLATLFLAVICIMNREKFSFHWNPLQEPLVIPQYLVILFFAGFGFIFGMCVMWLNTESLRRIKREQKKEIKTLSKEIQTINTQNKAQAPAKEFFLALPPKL